MTDPQTASEPWPVAPAVAGAPRAPLPEVMDVGDGPSPDGTPRDGTPRDGAPRDGTPRDGAPPDGAPPDGAPPDGPPSGQRPSRRRRPSGVRSVIEWAVIIGIALIGALVIRTVLFQAFFIPSASMDPTLKVHDRILVNKLSYHVHPVHRGDIVVFRRLPHMSVSEGGIKDLVKRVIGLPGETIESTPDQRIEINGQILNEPYLPPGTALGPPIPKQVIPAGHYFVMGDNRTDSSDSRFFGPVPRSYIVGRAFILIWPLSDFGLL